METQLVSICSITYNHAPFIRQCLDGFLMQQCNFPIEIIINDDCSTDGTTEIIREYAEKYPDKIFPIFHEKNLYSQGVRGMFQKFVFPKARGKYIALCEGDDYWTDPLKLQKQVDFLESHPDYSMCFHRADVLCLDGGVNNLFSGLRNQEYFALDLMTQWLIPTCSAVFRTEVVKHIPKCDLFKVGDGVIFASCLLVGRMYCVEGCMSVYNRHDGGWSAGEECHEKYLETMTPHYIGMLSSFPDRIVCPLKDKVAQMYLTWLKEFVAGKKTMHVLAYLPHILFLCPVAFVRAVYLDVIRHIRRFRFGS